MTTQATSAPATSPIQVSADDVNTACLRSLTYLRRLTGQDVTGLGISPWEVATVRSGGWLLVGHAWLIADPATRWDVWCQMGTRHVGLRVQVSRTTAPSRG